MLYSRKYLLSFLFLFNIVSTLMSNPSAVQYVDLDRYMGRWYVIRNTPYFLEKDKVASYDTYTKRSDGKIEADFTFKKNNFNSPEKIWKGVGVVQDTKSNAVWKVSFLWPLSSDYVVYALDKEYTWVVVGTKNADLVWVLSRTRQLSDDISRTICAVLKDKNIATDKLVIVPQPTN